MLLSWLSSAQKTCSHLVFVRGFAGVIMCLVWGFCMFCDSVDCGEDFIDFAWESIRLCVVSRSTPSLASSFSGLLFRMYS